MDSKINKYFVVFLTLFLFLQTNVFSENQEQPKREKGISVYFNPESVVNQVNLPHIQRFIVKHPVEESVVASDKTVEGLIDQIKRQPIELQRNGIWIVITNPESYSPTDKLQLENLEKLSKVNGIPYFKCRASELPNGWKRIH